MKYTIHVYKDNRNYKLQGLRNYVIIEGKYKDKMKYTV